MNHELLDVQGEFRNGTGTRDQISKIHWIIGKSREFQKNIYFCFIDYAKVFHCVDHKKLENSLRNGNTRSPYLTPENIQVKKQHLKLDMEKQPDSKLGKEYVKALYCYPAYLTYMQITSCKMPGWMKHKLESRLLGEISITSDTQIITLLWQKVKGN